MDLSWILEESAYSASFSVFIFLPARASEQGNVIGLVSVYIYVKIVIEQTRDLIYLKFVATDFSPKITSPNTGEHSGAQHSPCYSAVSALLTNPLPDRSTYSPLCHTQYLTPTINQAASWRLILQSSLLQCFTAESSQELSA